MKLSIAAELGLRGAVVLAEEYGRGPITLEKICSRRDLPKQYLVKIFASLSRAGLVTPVRGKRGGYMLARDPKDVSLLQLIEAIEGPLALNLCQQNPCGCDEVDCPIRPLWRDLQQTVCEKLAGMTLFDCVNGHPERPLQSDSLTSGHS